MLKYGYSTKSDGDMKDPENVRKLLEEFSKGNNVTNIVEPKLHQGSIILTVAEQKPLEQPRGDGLISKVKGVALAVKFADCFPVMFYCGSSEVQEEVIAIVHAGWRGIKAGIIEEAVKKMNLMGCLKFDVLIGPGICPKDYPIRENVALDFDHIIINNNNQKFLDLRSEIIRRLLKMGVQEPWIKNLDACTKHDETFFSARGGDKEQNMALIGIV